MTIQEKVLCRVRAAIEDDDFDAVEQRQFSNVGEIRAMTDLDTEFVYAYDFQNGYASISLSGPAVDRLIKELGVRSRTYSRTGVTIQYLELGGEEFRVEDATGVRGISLPVERRKRYVQWHHLTYEGEKLRSMIRFVEELAAFAVRHPTTR